MHPSIDRRRLLTVIGALALTAMATVLHAATDGTVILPPASINASGIVTAPLAEQRQTPERQGIATVLDPQALLAASAQLQAAHARVASASAAVQAAAAEARRSHLLYAHGENASLREVQSADAMLASTQAQRSAAQADETAARSGARAQWGARLIALGAPSLGDFADGKAALLAVVVPAAATVAAADTIQLQVNGVAVPAHLLGPSPRADAVVQGPTYFYRADGGELRIGQRVTAELPQGAATRSGVTVPQAAVLWYAGQPWAYVETARGHFQRRPLAQDARDATGWFQTRGFRVGDRVVVRGGELLLSQELQPPPGTKPAGGDDDDG